jgi:ribokinase
VDTTAAGDTYLGYLAAEIAAGADFQTAMQTAGKAAASAVSRPGAIPSIPFRRELQNI